MLPTSRDELATIKRIDATNCVLGGPSDKEVRNISMKLALALVWGA